MAPQGTPVGAAAAGTVEKLFESEAGGLTLYVRSPDRRLIYYYAHLQGYAPGLAEGQRVSIGQPLGAVGSTGNADPAGPHLHFAIHAADPSQRWHDGIPINPYPVLAGRRGRRNTGALRTPRGKIRESAGAPDFNRRILRGFYAGRRTFGPRADRQRRRRARAPSHRTLARAPVSPGIAR